MAEARNHPSEDTSVREIVSTRIVNAPHEIVWKAWTDPQHLARWWGPTGFTNTFHEFDLKVGGAWRFTMHGPDGTNYRNVCEFVEIVKPERLVFDHTSGPKFRVTTTFESQGSRTKITFRMVFRSAGEYEAAKGLAIQGNEQMFDRLAADLETLARTN